MLLHLEGHFGSIFLILFFNFTFYFINAFMPNVFFHPYQLDEFIFNFRVVGWYFFIKSKIMNVKLFVVSI